MKACIVLQNQYSILGHALACQLKERHGIKEFCAYVYSPEALNLIKSQKDINYHPVLVDHKLHANHIQEFTDMDFIRRFEREYFPPNIWQYLYADRKLMMSIGPKEETTVKIDPLYNHETLIRIFIARARAIEKMLKEERPDFILFFAIGSIGHKILYHVAKKLGIRTLCISSAQLGGARTISEEYGSLTGVQKILSSDEGPKKEFIEEAVHAIESFRKTGSLNLDYVQANKSRKTTGPIHKIWKSFRYLINLCRNYLAYRNTFIYGETKQNPFRFITHQLKRKFRALRGFKDLWDNPKKDEDYVYFAIHYEPELATLSLAPFYFDQIALIRQISRSLPFNYKLYVKDHPGMRNRRSRNFFKKLKKLPNVKILGYDCNGIELIKNSKIVMTITGTTGFEASFFKKPVITFGKVFYNDLSFIRKISSIEKLPAVIRELLDDFKFDENEFTRFIAASLQDSTSLKFYDLWYETDPSKLRHDKEIISFSDMIYKKASEHGIQSN